MRKQTGFIKSIFLSLTILLFVQQIKAQVTIGTSNKPHDGALLDLSGGQSDSGDGIVNKGLGLPRVALEKIDQLFPMFNGDSGYKDGTTKDDLDLQHIGLVVYNTSTCINNSSAYPQGMYVWDGKEWQLLNKLNTENISIFKDQDSKDFKARLFGDAGIWMVENLSVTKYAAGQGGSSLPSTPSGSVSHAAPLWCYPGTDHLDPTLFDMQPSLGLLYNWNAATRKSNPTGIDEGGTNEGVKVQGICPDGWHLPSDKEWTDLENEMIINTSKYSTMENIGGPILPYDRVGATTSPHGKAMKAQCMIAGSVLPDAFGASFPAYRGGFDVYLGGYAPPLQLFGLASFFWTSSSSNALNGAWLRRINAVKSYPTNLAPETFMSRTTQGTQMMTAIRCKKDTNTP